VATEARSASEADAAATLGLGGSQQTEPLTNYGTAVQFFGSTAVIPPFRLDGLLPKGLHQASEFDVIARFAIGTPERKRLGRTVAHWLRLCRSAGAKRFCLNGSFVTAKEAPNDADAVVWLGPDFTERIAKGNLDAIELADLLGTRADHHIFAAEDGRDWDDWIDFFTRTTDPSVRKGLVEVTL
jgi:hypothetical protein